MKKFLAMKLPGRVALRIRGTEKLLKETCLGLWKIEPEKLPQQTMGLKQ